MPSPTRKGIFIVLLAMVLVVGVAVVPEKFGEEYLRYLAGIVALGLIVLLFYSTDLRKWLRPGAAQSRAERFNIPPGAATRKQINLSRTAISQAEPEQALRHLSDLKVPALDTEIATLSSRYAEYRRSSRQGINSRDEENRTYNRITKGILDLIKTLESELATGTENYQTIKDYLKKRYTNRLGQKLAKRQPVNLRRLVNTEVLPEDNKPAFIEYKSEEISGALLQTFRDARGRLLLVGAPGAGKTTLLLQLVLELLEAEPDHLPVVLNLATWSKEYITLEGWLKKILAAEIGVSEKYAAEIIQQNRLIPLFDGFDEIREEDRLSCLEAINRYGEDTQRQYAISSRKQEFKEVNKAVVVHLPIEVCPLELEQMKVELQRLWEKPDKPERGAKFLLDAIENNTLLQEAVQTPFYFNTLQTLFNGGKTLSELDLKANSVDELQRKITERFVNYELEAAQANYPKEKAEHWLSFLASRMTQRNMVVFELRDLQYDWWRYWSKASVFASAVLSLFIAGFLGMFLILLPMLWIQLGIALGTWKGFLFSLSISFGFLLFIALFGGFFQKTNFDIETRGKYQLNRISLLSLGIYASVGALIGLVLKSILIPITAIIVGLSRELFDVFQKRHSPILQISTPYQHFIASAQNLHFSIFEHLLLRYQLYRQGLLPLRLVDFLNELSARHILETDGATWRFRHRILQEWFAGRWVEPEENTKPSK